MDAIIEEKKQQVLAQREAAARQEQADRERKQAEEERQNLAKAKKRAEEERVRKEAERAEHKQRREQEEREQHERKARELGAKRKADMHVVSEALIAASTVKEVDRESKAEESPEPSWGQIVKMFIGIIVFLAICGGILALIVASLGPVRFGRLKLVRNWRPSLVNIEYDDPLDNGAPADSVAPLPGAPPLCVWHLAQEKQ